jgi:acetyl-CoA C-acetyltransferase
VVAEAPLARELAAAPVEIAGMGAAGDVTVIADRRDPLRLEAAARAAAKAGGASGLAFLEVSSACSILEILAVESIGVAEPGTVCGRYKDGLGRAGSPLTINPGGGAQGRGFGFGASGLEQAREALLQLGAGAGKRQVEAASQPGATGLSLCLAGIGSQAFATLYRRMGA